MQTLSVTTLPSPAMTVAADTPAGVGDAAGGEGMEATFAALLQRREVAPLNKDGAPPVTPEAAAEIDPFSSRLPKRAASGKILPVAGKEPASPSSGDDEGVDAELAISVSPFPLLALPPAPTDAQLAIGAATNRIAGTEANDSGRNDHLQAISFQGAAIVPCTATLAGANTPSPAPAITDAVMPQRIVGRTADGVVGVAVAVFVDAQALARAEQPAAPQQIANSTLPPALPTAPIAVSIAATASGDAMTVPAVAASIRTVHALEAGDRPVTVQTVSSTIAHRADIAAGPRPESQQQQGERSAADGETGAQTPAPPSRLANFDLPAPMQAVGSGGGERASSAAPLMAAPAVPIAMPDRAEAIASVVDRLAAAREAGMNSFASVGLGHRDFGEITVSFASKGNGLEVSVTAADDENQRALAAALHVAERPVTRETASPVAQHSASLSASIAQDRGAEGQLARDADGRQHRGEPANSRQGVANTTTPSGAETEPPTAGRSGIYV